MIKCGDDQDGVTAMHDLAIVVQYVGRGPSWRCGSLMNVAKALWKRKGAMISLWSISTRTLSSSVLAPSKSWAAGLKLASVTDTRLHGVWKGRKAPELAGVFSRFQAGIGLAYRAREVIFRFRCMCAIALAANEIASLSKVGWYFLKQEFTVSQAFRLGYIRTSLEYIRDVWWPKVPSFDVWNGLQNSI